MPREKAKAVAEYEQHINREVEELKEDNEGLKALVANWESAYRDLWKERDKLAREIDDLLRYIILNEEIAKMCKEENCEQSEEYFKGKHAAFVHIRKHIEAERKIKRHKEAEQ